jgi:hypothetical protein
MPLNPAPEASRVGTALSQRSDDLGWEARRFTGREDRIELIIEIWRW